MMRNDIKKALIKIEILWDTISKEKSDDPDAYDFISIQSHSLQKTALELKLHIEEEIRKDKRARLMFQNLTRSLGNIIRILDLSPLSKKDKKDIDSILKKLLDLRKDIEVIRRYLHLPD